MIRQITATMLLMVATPQLALADGILGGLSGGGAGGLLSMAPLVLIMAIFYFLLIRPQQKRFKARKTMIDELKKGDKVITAGGIYGQVTDVNNDLLKVELADGVRVRIQRDTITALAD
ncbi:MAG: preprotein translocase subunit YajC [Mariprofundales bacterium]|nr:preprotein translocase subunit YajC [Mariprofundales bacterium]